MKVNRSIYMKLYKLFLNYTYPLIVANTANNRIFYSSKDSYWIELSTYWIFYVVMSYVTVFLPITYAIARYYKPFTKIEGLVFLFSYSLIWVPLIYLLHRRNRIKPLFNRMKIIPLEEVKALRKSYFMRFMLYYIIPVTFASFLIVFLP